MQNLEHIVIQKFIDTINRGSHPLQLMYTIHDRASEHVHMENNG